MKETETKKETIYNLKLHETMAAGSNWATVMRVAGGWIYTFTCPPEEGSDFGVFVPFDNEFMSDTDEDAR